MRIILSGGGTLGPVTPLIAVLQELRAKRSEGLDLKELWIGTRRGRERELVRAYQIPFKAISSAKLRRSFDARNFLIPVFLLLGFFESFAVLFQFRPDVVVSAGGFVSVPLVWASWFWRVPVIIHQEDLKIGLANLFMAPFATAVTTAFFETLKQFPHGQKRCVGNPVRREIAAAASLDKKEALARFGFADGKPVLLVLGGGTGASILNSLILLNRRELQNHFQIIHATGAGKGSGCAEKGYCAFEFLEPEILPFAYRASDIVLSRAGMGTLTELAALPLAAVLVPIPGSAQAVNAEYLVSKDAAMVLDQNGLDGRRLISILIGLWDNKPKMEKIKNNLRGVFLPDSARQIAELCLRILKK